MHRQMAAATAAAAAAVAGLSPLTHAGPAERGPAPSLNPTTAAAWSHPLLRNATVTVDAVAVTHTYTVQPGDSLSSIAAKLGIANWADLWWWNRGQVSDPNVIQAGQVLTVWRYRPPYASWEGYVTTQADDAIPKPPPPVQTVAAVQQPSQPSGQADPPAQQPAAPQGTLSGPWPGGAFGNCVVERESGGNPDVMNASGHYGLYQFSFSTWVAYGGDPGSFGHASVAEQEQVFLTAMSQPGGAGNWAPYDGC